MEHESSRPAHGVQFMLVRDAAGRELASTKPPSQEFGDFRAHTLSHEQMSRRAASLTEPTPARA